MQGKADHPHVHFSIQNFVVRVFMSSSAIRVETENTLPPAAGAGLGTRGLSAGMLREIEVTEVMSGVRVSDRAESWRSAKFAV